MSKRAKITLNKLECPLSGAEFCSHDRIHFKRSRGTCFCKRRTFQAHFVVELKMRLKPRFRRQNMITRMHLLLEIFSPKSLDQVTV